MCFQSLADMAATLYVVAQFSYRPASVDVHSVCQSKATVHTGVLPPSTWRNTRASGMRPSVLPEPWPNPPDPLAGVALLRGYPFRPAWSVEARLVMASRREASRP